MPVFFGQQPADKFCDVRRVNFLACQYLAKLISFGFCCRHMTQFRSANVNNIAHCGVLHFARTDAKDCDLVRVPKLLGHLARHDSRCAFAGIICHTAGHGHVTGIADNVQDRAAMHLACQIFRRQENGLAIDIDHSAEFHRIKVRYPVHMIIASAIDQNVNVLAFFGNGCNVPANANVYFLFQ